MILFGLILRLSREFISSTYKCLFNIQMLSVHRGGRLQGEVKQWENISKKVYMQFEKQNCLIKCYCLGERFSYDRFFYVVTLHSICGCIQIKKYVQLHIYNLLKEDKPKPSKHHMCCPSYMVLLPKYKGIRMVSTEIQTTCGCSLFLLQILQGQSLRSSSVVATSHY